MRGAFLSLVSCLLLSAAPAASAATTARPLPDLIRHVKRAVVIVNAFDGRGRPLSQGSGFFVAANRIITNLHVVGRASRVEVETFDGRSYAVEGIVAFDAQRDLTLLQTLATSPAATTLKVEASGPRAGEEIFVVSNPRGDAWRVSRGTTLALWDFQDIGTLLRITATISQGSSGGPVVNRQGRVVGVATMNLKASEELYFAVPCDRIADLRTGPLKPFPLLAGE
jgi:S1-C subfamily serine protease